MSINLLINLCPSRENTTPKQVSSLMRLVGLRKHLPTRYVQGSGGLNRTANNRVCSALAVLEEHKPVIVIVYIHQLFLIMNFQSSRYQKSRECR